MNPSTSKQPHASALLQTAGDLCDQGWRRGVVAWKRLVKPYINAHLKENNESYVQHALFAVPTGLRIMWTGLALIVHGFMPFIFTKTAGDNINEIYAIFRIRRRMNHDTQEPPQ